MPVAQLQGEGNGLTLSLRFEDSQDHLNRLPTFVHVTERLAVFADRRQQVTDGDDVPLGVSPGESFRAVEPLAGDLFPRRFPAAGGPPGVGQKAHVRQVTRGVIDHPLRTEDLQGEPRGIARLASA